MTTKNELTKEQIDRQDLVDNAIAAMLTAISNNFSENWDAYDLGKIRDAAEELIVRDYSVMTTEEFYPFFFQLSSEMRSWLDIS